MNYLYSIDDIEQIYATVEGQANKNVFILTKNEAVLFFQRNGANMLLVFCDEKGQLAYYNIGDDELDELAYIKRVEMDQVCFLKTKNAIKVARDYSNIMGSINPTHFKKIEKTDEEFYLACDMYNDKPMDGLKIIADEDYIDCKQVEIECNQNEFN